LRREKDRNSIKLQGKANDDDGEKSAQAQMAFKELEYAVSILKDWVYDRMITALPNSIVYVEKVDEIKSLEQQAEEIRDRKRNKTQALLRLQSLNTTLGSLTAQPQAGSSQEKVLVSLKKQYEAIRFMVSTSASVEATRGELLIAKEKLAAMGVSMDKLTREQKKYLASWELGTV